MQTKIIIGPKPAPKSLRKTANKWREKAVRLQQRALLLEEAAAQLDKDQEKKPAFIPL